MDRLLKKCIDFHGHKCLGLLMGWRTAKYAMKLLEEKYSKDEELVCIVENSSCFIDAVSVVCGCSLGKGNLIFKDYGKMALTLFSRNSSKGVRVYLDSTKIKRDSFEYDIMNKVFNGNATKKEIDLFKKIKKKREEEFLKLKDEDIFKIKWICRELPPKAKIYQSIKCDTCQELVMETRITKLDGKNLCIECRDNN
ncbi:MAG: FmdE family protein [Endomicrobia bacterium]|nr:FmdE family protein [Endomicrobiia bacterium]